MFRFVLPTVALLAGSAAVSADDHGWRQRQEAQDEAKLAKALTGFTAGKTVDCIQERRARDTSRYGDKILYRYSPREVYLTDTGGGCYGLRRGDAIVTKSFTDQLCRGDIVRSVDLASRTQTGSCSLGSFTRYTR